MSEPSEPSGYVPPAIGKMVDQLHEATGHQPAVARVGVRKWRITMENERVRMTFDMTVTGPGRAHGAGSTLTIDGERVELAANVNHFVRIWKDPDGELHRRWLEPAPITIPLQARPVGDAPAKVRQTAVDLTNRLGDRGATITVGITTDEFWAVQVETCRSTMRINYHVLGNGHCHPANEHPFQLLVDGVDRSAEVRGSLERAVGMLLRPAHNAAPAAPPVAGPAGPARTTSVEVRRATVIRT